jgi:uncharacterized membrane protein
MTVALPLHIVATIVWLGGLFLLCVVLQSTTRNMELKAALLLWHKVLSRFFVWAWISMALIVGSGIALVSLKFGGFAGAPALHRGNMLIGIPAIILYGYVYFVPWQRCRRAMARSDWGVAEKALAQARKIMTVVLALGLAASAVSAFGRYYV